METVELTYRVLTADFREASYYALFLRKRGAFRLAAGALIVFFIYAVLCVNGVVTMHPAGIAVFLAALIWSLMQLAGVERRILQYAKAPDTLIGAVYTARFGTRRFTISIPERDFSVSGELSELAAVFEITHCFLLYVTGEQLFILPTREMTAEQAAALRSLLSAALGGRFSSLFATRRK